MNAQMNEQKRKGNISLVIPVSFKEEMIQIQAT